MEPVIPDFAGKVIIIAKIDYGLHLWTADSWEIVLAGPVLVSGTGTAPNPHSRRNWRTWSERPLLSCWSARAATWACSSKTGS
jgi:hypothetical protein